MNVDPIEVDYGDGEKGELTDLYTVQYEKEYNPGEYVLKFKNVKDFSMIDYSEYEIEILQWGKILEKDEENIIIIPNVSKIYEPEPDKIPISYRSLKLTEIPEWLFSKKVTSKVMSTFIGAQNIKNISERLFENNVNVTSFDRVFEGCSGIRSIPEGLFKNNVNVTSFDRVFEGCSGLTSIPEGLFKNNVNVKSFGSVFSNCSGITSIPEGLFKNNVNVTSFWGVFSGCRGITSIPEGLFKNNVNAMDFSWTFSGCTGLTSIPEIIVEFAKKIKEKGGYVYYTFNECTSASNYASIPDYMK